MLNHIEIMGRLTKEPEIRYTQSNTAVASFTVAVDRDYGRSENGDRQTDFIDCTAWRQTAEFVSKYLHKGSMVVVSGRLQSNPWEDRNGQKRVSWEINVENVYFGESRRTVETNNRSTDYNTPTSSEPEQGTFKPLFPNEDVGELPF